ncbi:MAG: 50S ribosomal protein L24 [Candidatus Aenigmarchaeota archaeon ex4484_56]|nr:MAG: 50S ribosomal protein L24 [Candidatus Aenigmarchaeota archaeon ex4484_56]
MRQKFSVNWIRSKQPRKQRKYRINAPMHIRQKFIHANLSEELRKKYNRRSMPVRVDDNVKIMRGSFKGKIAKITKVNLKTLKVYLEGIVRKKADGREVQIPISPSNLQIISLSLEDKKREKIIKRKNVSK